MTDQDLAELDRLAQAATPPPWTVDEAGNTVYVQGDSDGVCEAEVSVDGPRVRENMAFISAARDALPRLVRELRRCREALENADGALQYAANTIKYAMDHEAPAMSLIALWNYLRQSREDLEKAREQPDGA